jgi:hypothetical protein
LSKPDDTMDIKTISATLALLGSGLTLPACDDAKKDATEVDKKADAKDGDKAKDGEAVKADGNAKAADKSKAGEMACGEGGCGEGNCGGKKAADDGDDDKALAGDGEPEAKDAAEPAPDDDAKDKS